MKFKRLKKSDPVCVYVIRDMATGKYATSCFSWVTLRQAKKWRSLKLVGAYIEQMFKYEYYKNDLLKFKLEIVEFKLIEHSIIPANVMINSP